MSTAALTSPQSEILNMMSFVKSQETFVLLKQVISDFFAKEADKELDAMWNSGELSDERVEGFRNLHERTPYK